MPQDRKEYFRQYRQKHQAKLIQRSKEHYERNKKKRLLYAKKYYILNKRMILAKAKKQSTEFLGHAQAIHKAVVKYAKEWKVPYCEWNEFKQWTSDDVTYEDLFNQWKESGYDRSLSPVAMRGVKKNGFVVDNLTWSVKKNYSWWSEDRILIQQIEENLNEEQKVLNKRDKDWQEKTKEQIKALRKRKK